MVNPYKMPRHELEGLRELAANRFVLESVGFLNNNFKSQTEHLSEDEKYQFVKEQFSKAEIYQIDQKPEYWKWLIVVMNLGANFIDNPLYQDMLVPYLEKVDDKVKLNIEVLVDEIINWADLGILPRHTGIAPHLKDVQPIVGKTTSDFAQGLGTIDKEKYKKIGFNRVVVFLEQEQEIYAKHQIIDKDKGWWYFTLAWYLGTDFLSNPCYKELKDIYTTDNKAEEIDEFIKTHLQEKYETNKEVVNA